MKTITMLSVLGVLALGMISSVSAATKVKSYYKPSTGTYVNSYYKSNSNGTKLDNYSTKGNYNPYTGKAGTKRGW